MKKTKQKDVELVTKNETVPAEPEIVELNLVKEEPKPWTPDDEYSKLYGWIGKGNIDDTLKAILKELVTIRMRG